MQWLESGMDLRGMGLAPSLRVEDFVEDETYVLRAEMPGLDPEKDVELTVEDDVLTIRGERREEKKDKHHQEFHYGSFLRRIALPHGLDVEQIKATYDDGVLEVRVPAAANTPEPRKISVGRATG
jgi:HSP20 family molecular chaperone IbpA